MFYPLIFPVCAGGLEPQKALDVEITVISTIVGGDREWQRTLSPPEFTAKMADELRFLGIGHGEDEAPLRELLEANAWALVGFVRNTLGAKSESDWVWVVPDPRAFAALPLEVRERWWPLVVRQLQSPVDPE